MQALLPSLPQGSPLASEIMSVPLKNTTPNSWYFCIYPHRGCKSSFSLQSLDDEFKKKKKKLDSR